MQIVLLRDYSQEWKTVGSKSNLSPSLSLSLPLQSLFYSFQQDLLGAYYVSDTTPGCKSIEANRTYKVCSILLYRSSLFDPLTMALHDLLIEILNRN